MRPVRFLLIILLAGLPTAVNAGLNNGDLPSARWYAHVDLEAMRSSEAGRHLYAWLEEEVFDELREEFGFDANTEANVITALASPDGGITVVIDGNFSQRTEDRIVALGALASEFNALKHEGKTYYHIVDDDAAEHRDAGSFDDGAFVSIAIKNKLLVTSSESQMRSLITSKGKFPGDYKNDGALLVLSAEKNLVQAGMSTNSIGDDLGWDSNMLRNTRQLALLVADEAGKIAVEARLIAAEEEMASSLASIVRGLISLQVFNEDIDPQLARFLQGTAVEVDGATLSIKLVLDPELLIGALD